MSEAERTPAREGYDLWAPTYDSTENPVVEADSRCAIQLLDPQPGERILDAGCGTGRNLGPLLDSRALPAGLDFSPGMLAVARASHPRASLFMADLQAPLPLRDAQFDAVLCSLIGEHLDRLAHTLQEFRRVTRPGGRLVFTVYHPDLAFAGVEANFEAGGRIYRLGAVLYSVQDYFDLIAAGGFRIETAKEIADPVRKRNILLAVRAARA